MKLGRGELQHGDCLQLMQAIPDKSVDMILCDPPFGTTACAWDTVIDLPEMWKQYNRILKDYRAMVLFGAEPFSSALRSSNFAQFKYDWIWHKTRALGFTNAKNKPMNKHEVISVFSNGTTANRSPKRMLYNPQGLVVSGKIVSGIKACAADESSGGHKFGRKSHKASYIQEYTNYPTSVLAVANEGKTVHPTQKPVALFEYLIRTYTDAGMTVLDNCSGSGTLAIAAENTDRRWICMEYDKSYHDVSLERIKEHLGVSYEQTV